MSEDERQRFEWFAVDEEDHVAVMSCNGTGLVPRPSRADAEMYEAVLDAFAALPRTGRASAEDGEVAHFQEIVEKGLFLFEWDGSNWESIGYEPRGWPDHPVPLSELALPAPVKDWVRRFPLRGVRFQALHSLTLEGLDAAGMELCVGEARLAAWRLPRAEHPRGSGGARSRPPMDGPVVATAEFHRPVESTEPLRFVLKGLIDVVCWDLRRRQRLAARLQLTLRVGDISSPHVREVRPAQPTANERVLAGLCWPVIKAHPPDCPVHGIELVSVDEVAAPDGPGGEN